MKQLLKIQVFNHEFSGQDAIDFCKKSDTDKFAWIKKNVEGVTDEQIDEFLKTELKHSIAKCGCAPSPAKVVEPAKPAKKKTSTDE